jgi:LysM repeat protein
VRESGVRLVELLTISIVMILASVAMPLSKMVGRLDSDRDQKRINVLQLSIKKLTQEVAALHTLVRDSLLCSKPSRVSDESAGWQIQPGRGLIVKAGDTLFSIARRYAVALTDLKNVNRLRTDLILVGQLLVIPEP